jgi:hypothetical protein
MKAKFILIISILFFYYNIKAQDTVLTKKFNFEYPVNIETIAEITNSYGSIVFETIQENKIQVSGEISSRSTSFSKAAKRLGQVMLYKDTASNKVIIKTMILKKDFENYDKNNRVTINYLVKIPIYLKLQIKNEYGNIVFKNEHHGKLNIDLFTGNLTTGILLFQETKPISTIKTKYSDVNIKKCNWAKIDCASTNLNIGESKSLIIATDKSVVNIGICNVLYCSGVNDVYTIKRIGKLAMNSKKTKLTIDELENSIDFKGELKPITIKHIAANFTSVKIKNKQANVYARIDDNASYKVFCQADLGEIEHPQKANLNRHLSSDYNRIEGIVGSNKNTSSIVEITTSYGKISL